MCIGAKTSKGKVRSTKVYTGLEKSKKKSIFFYSILKYIRNNKWSVNEYLYYNIWISERSRRFT